MSRTVGGYLAESLSMNGIDTVFGIPGVHNLELYRGLTPRPSAMYSCATNRAPVLLPMVSRA